MDIPTLGRQLIKRVIVASVLLAATWPALAQTPDNLKSLYDQHRLFELREALNGKHAPALYAGAVASAFNHSKSAKHYLDAVIKSSPRSADALEAHGQLAYMYARLGKNREAVQELDDMLAIKPGQADVENARALFSAFSAYPDMFVARKQQGKVLGGSVSSAGLEIPLSINGHSVKWIIDSGANFSTLSESEARMLGLAIGNQRSQMVDSNGGFVTVQTVNVKAMRIGQVEIHNVPFTVVPDSGPPFNDLRPGERGILGLPVLVALGTLRWYSSGVFETGFPPLARDTHAANLCFDGLTPDIRVTFQGKPLEFTFDTGNGAGTQLWSRFSAEYASLLKESGAKSVKKVTQMGGAAEREVLVIPELRLQVGGFDTVLKPANVFSKPVGNDTLYGLLGMDLLSQAREVTVDFRSMRVILSSAEDTNKTQR